MQQISVITLGVADPERALRFYADGFGWTPVFQNHEIIFFQMNGLMLGLFQRAALDADMGRVNDGGAAAIALAHNVLTREEVAPLMQRLSAAGGVTLRAPDAPPHGGYRGYVADPDGHAWEIAWNPAWPIDAEGRVRFGL
ncbi:glyoxalase [Camelimonas fluminis]|uniref:VOC family protein n=1 Tax=Camelimonas fluminis TaxID=1576911 RepID=A0ABV7UG22_9HYPH|nr:VOC family protein [Camelimonas fluminis]GHE50604.1 glyoxalase [Camelimonas fluminis]